MGTVPCGFPQINTQRAELLQGKSYRILLEVTQRDPTGFKLRCELPVIGILLVNRQTYSRLCLTALFSQAFQLRF